MHIIDLKVHFKNISCRQVPFLDQLKVQIIVKNQIIIFCFVVNDLKVPPSFKNCDSFVSITIFL